MRRFILASLFLFTCILRGATGDVTCTVETMADIPGSLSAGSFVAGETVTQLVTGATGKYSSNTTNHLVVYELRGSPDGNVLHTWSGATAVWAPTSGVAPVPMTIYARVVVTGFTTGATYHFGFTGAGAFSATTPYITGVSKGFDGTTAATTTTYTAYLDKVMRIPGTANPDESSAGGNLTVRIGLADLVYLKDNTGGGNSGTAPTFTTFTNFITNTGGSSQQSIASGPTTITNNSQLAYYVPRGPWDMTPIELRADADYHLGFDTQYVEGGFDGIACVRFDADGQTSSVNVNHIITTRSKTRRTGSGLYSDSYDTSIAISGFTQGEQIKNRVRVYPKRGDTIFDSNNFSSDYAIQQDSTLTYYCDKTDALRIYAVVDNVGGTSGGVASATLASARAAPYQFIQQALVGGATLIYIKNQQQLFSTPASTPTALGYWREIQQDPTDLGGAVLIDTGFLTTKCDLKFTNVTVKLTGNLSILTSTTDYALFDGCAMDANGQSLAATFCDDLLGGFFSNCTWVDFSKFKLIRSGSDIVRYSFDGCDFGTSSSSSQHIGAYWKMVACKGSGVCASGGHSTATALGNIANRHFKNNLFTNVDDTLVFDSFGGAITDQFFQGSVLEGVDALASNPLIELWDGNDIYSAIHGVIAQNTWLGQRTNYLYNDSVAGTANYPIYSLGWSITGNIFGNQEIKSDSFTTANANRVGDWQVFLGTLSAGNFARISDFPPDYAGQLSITSVSDPLFTNDRSGSTSGGSQYHYNANSGLGSGTYSRASGGPCSGLLPLGARHAAYDLIGNPIPASGGAAGAYQDPPTATTGFFIFL